MGAAVEGLPAHELRCFARYADLHQHAALGRQAPNRMVTIIGAVNRSVRSDVYAVRVGEDVLAPGPQEIALAVEHHHWMGSAVEYEYVVALIDPDRGDFVKRPAGRQLRPVTIDAVAERAFSQNDIAGLLLAFRHVCPPSGLLCYVGLWAGAGHRTIRLFGRIDYSR